LDNVLQLSDCLFTDNDGKCVRFGGDFNESASIHIVNCTFERNHDDQIWVDFYNSDDGPEVIEVHDCTFRNNSGGIYVVGGLITIWNNLFVENNLGWAPCVLLSGFNQFEVAFNTFAENSSLDVAGVILSGSGDMHHNTFYRCFTSGSEPPPNGASSARFESSKYGNALGFYANVLSEGEGAPAVSVMIKSLWGGCNLFWGNEGDYVQNEYQADISADPLFCDPDAFDFTVQEDSPCASGNTPGCDAIGAEGVGCGTVHVESKSWGGIKALYR
jgi:hypothetical protein